MHEQKYVSLSADVTFYSLRINSEVTYKRQSDIGFLLELNFIGSEIEISRQRPTIWTTYAKFCGISVLKILLYIHRKQWRSKIDLKHRYKWAKEHLNFYANCKAQ